MRLVISSSKNGTTFKKTASYLLSALKIFTTVESNSLMSRNLFIKVANIKTKIHMYIYIPFSMILLKIFKS